MGGNEGVKKVGLAVFGVDAVYVWLNQRIGKEQASGQRLVWIVTGAERTECGGRVWGLVRSL